MAYARDRDTRLILESTQGTAKSAGQIISESNIAPSTAYRKLRRLVDFNFLRIEHVMGDNGRWETRYMNNLCFLDSRKNINGKPNYLS